VNLNIFKREEIKSFKDMGEKRAHNKFLSRRLVENHKNGPLFSIFMVLWRTSGRESLRLKKFLSNKKFFPSWNGARGKKFLLLLLIS
jgi:hypothetical protein